MKEASKIENKSDVFFVNLTTETVTPSVDSRKHRKKEYIYFGKDNLFPDYLIDLADNCSIHRALLETKSKFIAGEGFIFEGEDGQVSAAEKFLEGLDRDFLRKTATDMSYFNGFYWQSKFERGGNVAYLRNIDFSYVRSGKMNENGEIEKYYFTPDWAFATKKTSFKPEDAIYEPKPIASWYSSDRALVKKRGELIEGKTYSPGKLFYAEPSYLGALNYIEISNQIAEFHKNNLDNGMVGSMHIHLFEDLSDSEKRRKVEKGISQKFVGSENAGKVVVTWSTNPDMKTLVESIPVNDSHEMFTLLNGKVSEEIVMAHRTPMALAGIKVATGLQSDEALTRSNMEYYQNTVIRPSQRVIEESLDRVLERNGIKVKTVIKPLRPIDILGSEELMSQVMTINEIRTKVLGIDILEEGGDSFLNDNNIVE
jgi:hypothetical protein